MERGMYLFFVVSVYLMPSALVMLLSIALINGSIEPNPTIGIRFKEAFESKENWYLINRYGGIQLEIWFGLQLLCGIGLLLAPQSFIDHYPALAYVGPIPLVFIPLLTTNRYAKRLSRSKKLSATSESAAVTEPK